MAETPFICEEMFIFVRFKPIITPPCIKSFDEHQQNMKHK